MENATDTGKKFDNNKCRMELLDPLALQGTAWVLTDGAAKYGDRNWENGIAFTRIIGAIHRHLNAIQRGEDIDVDSGRLHCDHLACEVMFLQRFTRTHPQWDDRPYIVDQRSDEEFEAFVAPPDDDYPYPAPC